MEISLEQILKSVKSCPVDTKQAAFYSAGVALAGGILSTFIDRLTEGGELSPAGREYYRNVAEAFLMNEVAEVVKAIDLHFITQN